MKFSNAAVLRTAHTTLRKSLLLFGFCAAAVSWSDAGVAFAEDDILPFSISVDGQPLVTRGRKRC